MKVLIACEYSGVVRDAFAEQGHDAWSCDLLPCERGGKHYQCDVLYLLNQFKTGYRDMKSHYWDFIGLHIPCTEVGLCGNKHYGKGMPKHQKRLDAITWTKEIIDTAKSICDKVYYENPKNVMGAYIGKRTQAIQPYQFGHMEQKETWLWLWGLPKLVETNNVYNEMMKLPKRERERIFHMSPSDRRGLERSRTYPGIAKAMAEQWGGVVEIKKQYPAR